MEKKYVFVALQITINDVTIFDKHVGEFASNQTPFEYAEQRAKTFFPNDESEDDFGTYCFSEGEVEIVECSEISEEEFEVMNKYI